ncbi:ExbD/TolR family protein [Yunchengibacter salinarum]|uniref:ExbD/TolR family protein n=1 Tax=Yunchengibacter salinarum TaxID=3133399 RepID=UPI0035B666FE
MRKFSKQEEEAEVNMTPMLDIVFIMLIFFIVTASFVKEAGIGINKPEDTPQDENQPPPPEDERAIAFLIDDANVIQHNFRRVNVSAVESIIKRESVERPKAPIVIQASEAAHTGIALQIYDAALAVGVDPSKIVVMPRK